LKKVLFFMRRDQVRLLLYPLCYFAISHGYGKGGQMTIGNALTFITRGLIDSALRERLNGALNASELQNLLDNEKLLFSANDFDEAFYHRLTQCQEAEEADQIKELKMWWDLLSQSLEPTAGGKQCSGCCE
jgi:hypothetical protein